MGPSRPEDGERPSEAVGEQKSQEQSEQDLRDKELIKAYLFKRLGRMAEESGKLEKLRKQLDEDIRNRQRNQEALVNESDSEQESDLPRAAGQFVQVSRSHSPARGSGPGLKPGAGKGHQPW